MSEKFVTLEVWARAQYGKDAPHVDTLRRWCREGYILPLPKKHGRSYFVSVNARYVHHSDPDYMRIYRESKAKT
jgi:hypothetical protein